MREGPGSSTPALVNRAQRVLVPAKRRDVPREIKALRRTPRARSTTGASPYPACVSRLLSRLPLSTQYGPSGQTRSSNGHLYL